MLLASSLSTSAWALSGRCDYTGPLAPPKGALVDTFRVMTMNVWGQNDDSENKCEARLNLIGRNIANAYPRFDIVGLTEVHPDYAFVSCNGRKLVDGIQVYGEYRGNKARWGHPETPDFEYDGGTSLFSTVEFDWTPYSEHVHRYRPRLNPRTAHGFVFSRIQLTAETAIDVYVTHLHSKGTGSPISPRCFQDCRDNELRQLAEGIHQRSANSGNPVIVMGDFNIGGPNPTADRCRGNRGYGDIMKWLRNPRDLWLEAHPNTRGDTHADQRIDFIFIPTDPYLTNSPWELTLTNPEEVNLIRWTLPGFDRGFGRGWVNGPFRISDHHGIATTLELRRKLDWATVITAIN